MLYILTGQVQIGKSRWLERLVRDLQEKGTECYGVISAGIWVRSTSGKANGLGFEKLGIESILLPSWQRFEFAQRQDLAKAGGSYNENSQAGKVGLGWHISDDAIARVNEHFAWISKARAARELEGLLVVDELGRLELERGGGLIEAMKLLEQGSDPCFENAIVVARDIFAHEVAQRYGDAWGGAQMMSPTHGK